jgi:integrase
MAKKRFYPKKPKVETLLADADFRRWYDQLGNGASSTADSWSRRLRGFCIQSNVRPKELLALDGRALRDLFIDYIAAEQKRGSAGSYIAFTLKVVRSWLRFNDRETPGRLKIRGADRVLEETAVSQQQLSAILDHASAREKVAVSLMAMSGIRPEVLGNFLGDDGLRIRDFPDLQIKGKEVAFGKVPARLIVRRDLSKAGHTYSSFLSAEGTTHLENYLNARLRGGERLGPESAIITPERAKKEFIRTTNIGDLVRNALRGAGFGTMRPYVLRTTFATRLLTCENSGKLPHTFAVFWMGHQGEMTSRYSVNRGALPADLIEDMRKAYGRCESTLSTIPVRNESGNTIKLLLMVAGMTQDEADKLDVSSMSNEELGKLAEATKARQSAQGPPPGQRAVGLVEVEGLLVQGWEYVGPLGADKAILRLPAVSNRPAHVPLSSEAGPVGLRIAGPSE